MPCSDGMAIDRQLAERAAVHHREVELLLERLLEGKITTEKAKEEYARLARNFKEWKP